MALALYFSTLDPPGFARDSAPSCRLEAVNELREHPHWYNALTYNCTDNIQALAVPYERRSWWKMEAPAERLPRRAGLRERFPRTAFCRFPVLKARSHINGRAKAAGDDPRFSIRIREGLPRMSLDGGRGGTMSADR